MQPELTKANVLKALQDFDSNHRDSPEWAHWSQNQAYKYAIRYRRRDYPVKKIASMASGVPVSEFSGGQHPGHTNRLFAALKFKIVPLTRSNPDWVRDELVVVLDFYLKHRSKMPDKTSRALSDLSALLNRLGEKLFPPSERGETFRNVNGTYMKLMNFRSLDPVFTSAGKKGLTAGSKADEAAWAEFGSDPEGCHAVAIAIIDALDDPEASPPVVADLSDEGEDEAPEGRLLARQHRYRERNRKLVLRKKKQVLQRQGKLLCEVCAFDFGVSYGEHGEGFIECHHTKPVSTLRTNAKTHLDDLALICANCHRMIHHGKKWLSIEELRKILRQ